MILHHIHIDSFGVLLGKDLTFDDGLNVIEGANESGKSTVSNFLLYLLYGLDKPTREKYIGWDTGYIGGHAIVSHEGEQYRIERENRNGRDILHIVRLSDNTVCFKDQCPGKVFLGVPEDLFARVAYVRQGGAREPEGSSVFSAIENLLFSGDESISADKAIKKLDELRVPLLHKNKKGGQIYTLRVEQQALEDELLRASDEQGHIISKEGTLAEWKRVQQKCKTDLETIENRRRLTQAISLCERFDRLDAENARLEQLDSYRAKLDREHEHNGKLPDYLFVNRLEELSREQQIYRRQYEVAQAEYADAESKEDHLDERRRLISLMEERGGMRAVSDTLARLDAKRKKCTLFGWIFIWLLPLGIILLHMAKKAKGEYDDLLSQLEIQPTAEPEAELRARQADADLLRDYRAALEARESNCRRQKEQLDACDSQIAAYLAEWGQTDLDIALTAARAYVSQKEALSESRREYEQSRRELLAQLKGANAEQARQDLTVLTARGVQPLSEAEAVKAEANRNYLSHQLASLQDGIHNLEVELASLRATVKQPAQLKEQLEQSRQQSAKLQRHLDALVLAGERMAQAATALRENISPRLSARAGELMAAMTGGKYETIGVSPTLDMEFTAQTQTGLHTDSVSRLSAGTEDLAYISLRLALGDLVFNRRGVPLVFDESFSRLDDTRLENVLGLLSDAAQKDGRQIILLSSSHRDCAALADRPYRKIEL